MAPSDLETRAAADGAGEAIALAERLDAEGRHEEALKQLARAANRGSVPALTRVGLRLLTGQNAPRMPREGAGLLAEAAQAGEGEAAAMLAVLAGAGLFQRQSWSDALDHLARAAEFGWAPAREQLLILAGDRALAARVRAGEPGPPGVWTHLRDSVDVAAWTSAPPPRVLCESPLARAMEGFVPPEACDWVIAQSRGKLVRAQVHDPRTGLEVMGKTRTNRVANFTLADTSLLNLLIQAKISAATGAPLASMEAFAVLNYRPGEQASEHFDYLDPAVPAYAKEIAELGQRSATFLLYLNDDYEGGETDFPQVGLAHRGGKGDAFTFSSVNPVTGAPDPRSVHAGRPPAAGEKWVLTQFIRDRAGVGPSPTGA